MKKYIRIIQNISFTTHNSLIYEYKRRMTADSLLRRWPNGRREKMVSTDIATVWKGYCAKCAYSYWYYYNYI